MDLHYYSYCRQCHLTCYSIVIISIRKRVELTSPNAVIHDWPRAAHEYFYVCSTLVRPRYYLIINNLWIPRLVIVIYRTTSQHLQFPLYYLLFLFLFILLSSNSLIKWRVNADAIHQWPVTDLSSTAQAEIIMNGNYRQRNRWIHSPVHYYMRHWSRSNNPMQL